MLPNHPVAIFIALFLLCFKFDRQRPRHERDDKILTAAQDGGTFGTYKNAFLTILAILDRSSVKEAFDSKMQPFLDRKSVV